METIVFRGKLLVLGRVDINQYWLLIRTNGQLPQLWMNIFGFSTKKHAQKRRMEVNYLPNMKGETIAT